MSGEQEKCFSKSAVSQILRQFLIISGRNIILGLSYCCRKAHSIAGKIHEFYYLLTNVPGVSLTSLPFVMQHHFAKNNHFVDEIAIRRLEIKQCLK